MIELDMECLLAEDDLVVDQAQTSPNTGCIKVKWSKLKGSEG